MEIYEKNDKKHIRVDCHECIKGGNGSGECDVGGNITDEYLHRGCWSGALIRDLNRCTKNEGRTLE